VLCAALDLTQLRGALALAAATAVVVLHRKIWSRLTHWRGGPKATTPYAPLGSLPAVRLAVAGDVGDSDSRLADTAAAVAALAARAPYDGLVLLGDNVYPAGDPTHLADTVFRPFAPLLDAGTPLLAVLGNHDVKRGRALAQVEALGMPGRWWARRIGDVAIVGLDSTRIDHPDQRAFLDEALAADATWKVVLAHHPPYSAGYQGSHRATRRLVAPLAARHGVQLVLSGHDHDYQRSHPIEGTTYVVTGAAAVKRLTGTRSFTAASFSAHHFVDLSFTADRLVLRAITADLQIADEATIVP